MIKRLLITCSIITTLIQTSCTSTKTGYRKMEPLDLQAIINDHIKTKKSILKLPSGNYKITNHPVRIDDVTNLTIDGTGTTLVFTKLARAIEMRNCKNVTLKGFTLDYDPLPFTQGTITKLANDKSWFEFSIHDGYHPLDKTYSPNRAYAFNPKTRLWKEGIKDMYGKIDIISPIHGKMTIYEPQAKLEVGDLVAFTVRKAGAINILSGCEKTKIEGVSILAAPGLAVMVRFGKGHDHFSYTVKRGPKPVNANQERLLSTSADAFNCAYTRNGPTLDNCDFSFMGDDSVNLHSVAFPIIKKISQQSFLVARPYGHEPFPVEKDDLLRLLDANNFAIKDTAAIATFHYVTNPEKISDDEILRLFPTSHKHTKKKFSVYKITLAKSINLEKGDFIDIPALSASGFTIKNSYFHDHRARGLRLMASDGLVENNRFERIKNSAISLGAEYAYWREAGWVNNIIVRNNTLKNIGTGPAIWGKTSYTPGAISIFVRQKGVHLPCPMFNSNITIENNKIDGCSVSGIFINGAKNVTIKNNKIKHTNTAKVSTAGGKYGLKPIEKGYTENIISSNNSH